MIWLLSQTWPLRYSDTSRAVLERTLFFFIRIALRARLYLQLRGTWSCSWQAGEGKHCCSSDPLYEDRVARLAPLGKSRRPRLSTRVTSPSNSFDTVVNSERRRINEISHNSPRDLKKYVLLDVQFSWWEILSILLKFSARETYRYANIISKMKESQYSKT